MGFHQWIEIGMLAVMILQLGAIIHLLERPRDKKEWWHSQPLMKGMGDRPLGPPPLD